MVLTAGSSASVVVVATGGNALVAPFGADVVGQRQRVLSDVGLGVVSAQAAVTQRVLEHGS